MIFVVVLSTIYLRSSFKTTSSLIFELYFLRPFIKKIYPLKPSSSKYLIQSEPTGIQYSCFLTFLIRGSEKGEVIDTFLHVILGSGTPVSPRGQDTAYD